MKTLTTIALALMMMPLTVSAAKAKKKQTVKKITAIETVTKMNDEYQANHKPEVGTDAGNAAYFAANMDLLGCVIEDLRLRFFELPNYYERTYNSHLKIFEAIRDGDEEAAVAETEHHMDLVLDFIREAELLDEEELSGKDG